MIIIFLGLETRIIWAVFIITGLLSVGVSYAITPITDEAIITTADGTTSPTMNLGQTGVIAWENFLQANTGDYIIGIEGGSNAIEITRAGAGILETRIFSDVFVNKNSPKLSVLALDTSTSPVLQFAQQGAVGWNYRLETGTGDLIIGVEGGQDAIEFTRLGTNVDFTTFLNGAVNMLGNLNVDGDIDVSGPSAVDDDAICFDDGSQCLTWFNSPGRFSIQELFINGGLTVEGTSTFQGGMTVQNGFTLSDGNLVVSEGSFTANQAAIFNNNIDLTGNLANDDDTIFFDDGTTTFLRWDDAPFGEFVLSQPLFVSEYVDIQSTDANVMELDRLGTDGQMIVFFNDSVEIGDISIAGTTVSYNGFIGSHYAWTNQEPQRGMLVSMNGQNKYLHDNPEAEILYGVEITTKKNDPAVLGAYLTLHELLSVPGLVNPHLVMSEGNGEAWIADMGQDIKPGDYLISSSVAGHAMKDDRSEELSHIIGRAAEPIDWSEVENTIDGVKHKKISILFNFVPLNNIVE